MNRRSLLTHASVAVLTSSLARAQPLPVLSDTVPPRIGPGPLWTGVPFGVSLDLSFMNPGTLDPRLTFTRGSTATYFNAAGTMQTAATNVPRWDYNPSTLVLNGLLIEEARTNLLLRSGDVSNAVWATAGGLGGTAPTVTGNQAVAPDGTTTAAQVALQFASGGMVTNLHQSVTASVALYTFSVWLRGSVGGEQTYIYITDGGSAYPVRQRVTLTTAWQRFSITTPSNLTAAAWYAMLGTDLRDASQSATVASTIYVWGAQFEQGAFPTSYIPTTGAAVTRSADLASMPTGTWFNPSAFSMMLEFYMPVPPAGAMGGFSDNTFGENTWYFGLGNCNKIGTNQGTATAPTAATLGAVNKQCGTFNTAGMKCNENGGAPGTYVAALVAPSGAIRLSVGDAPWSPGATPFNCHARRISVWPRVLSNFEMQSVTR